MQLLHPDRFWLSNRGATNHNGSKIDKKRVGEGNRFGRF